MNNYCSSLSSHKCFFFSERSLNSREIKSRHDELYLRIAEGFEEKEGSSTDQTVLLDYLNLDEGDKSLLTRAVKAVFPSSDLRRIRSKGCQTYLFLLTASLVPIC